MNVFALPCRREDVLYLDDVLLSSDGRIKLLPAAKYHEIDYCHLMAWGGMRARYTFPTIELVEWLKDKIAGREALEIGAGNGDLGYHLGIRRIDNYSQLQPDVILWYALHGMEVTQPTPDVEEIDAIDAINKYRPKVVVGSFITQKSYGDVKNSGNVYGPEEENILQGTDCYIHVGNENAHGDKRILRHPHQKFKFPWIVTKTIDQSKNVIYQWGK